MKDIEEINDFDETQDNEEQKYTESQKMHVIRTKHLRHSLGHKVYLPYIKR